MLHSPFFFLSCSGTRPFQCQCCSTSPVEPLPCSPKSGLSLWDDMIAHPASLEHNHRYREWLGSPPCVSYLGHLEGESPPVRGPKRENHGYYSSHLQVRGWSSKWGAQYPSITVITKIHCMFTRESLHWNFNCHRNFRKVQHPNTHQPLNRKIHPSAPRPKGVHIINHGPMFLKPTHQGTTTSIIILFQQPFKII